MSKLHQHSPTLHGSESLRRRASVAKSSSALQSLLARFSYMWSSNVNLNVHIYVYVHPQKSIDLQTRVSLWNQNEFEMFWSICEQIGADGTPFQQDNYNWKKVSSSCSTGTPLAAVAPRVHAGGERTAYGTIKLNRLDTSRRNRRKTPAQVEEQRQTRMDECRGVSMIGRLGWMSTVCRCNNLRSPCLCLPLIT